MMMKRILLAALLAGSQAAMAKDCETESGGATMSAVYACMQNEQYKDSVAVAYQKLERKLSRRPDLIKELRASQASWERFVSDSCGFLSKFDQGELGWADANYSCHSDFYSARIKVLNSWIKKAGG